MLREEKLSLSVIKLGKLPSAHLKLDDETVSRMHAIIEVNGPGDVSIIDLGSTKGTFVNGQKVNKAKLQSGDTIVVGDTRIELAIGAGEDEEDAPTRVQAARPAGHHRVDAAAARRSAGRAARWPPRRCRRSRPVPWPPRRRMAAPPPAFAATMPPPPAAPAASGCARRPACPVRIGGPALVQHRRRGAGPPASSRRWPARSTTSAARAPSRSRRCSATRSSA